MKLLMVIRMTEKIIEINNLKKSFSEFTALKNINLKINKGEVMGLLGPNGAGKTTTLKILTGLLKADQGMINIMGENISPNFPTWIKEKIGVVFEESNLYLRLTALDNLKLFAGINNIDENEIKKLLSEYELESVAEKEVGNFSKGMKKRLMICRALIAEPEILILDEATGGLDPISAEIIREKILELKSQGKTVILSTHYLEEADRLCDRIAFINRGKLTAVDRPENFKNNFKDKFLEIKFLIDSQNAEKNLNAFINSVLGSEDNYKIEKKLITFKLKIKQNIFSKAKKLAERFKLLKIDKIEADLQQVFNKLNNQNLEANNE